ncbi:MAG TPA: hypothetical protein VN706_06895 [Gemmatimonadaceae bacterium]|nr:hypothetical protein [Gemmatimonadaceae bacterium]
MTPLYRPAATCGGLAWLVAFTRIIHGMPTIERLTARVVFATTLFATTVFAAPAVAQSIPGAVLAVREPHHHLTYQDSVMRVLRVRVAAHDTTLLHEHDPDYFWISLGASRLVDARPRVPDATIDSKDLSIHHTPGHFAHVARNPGDVPFDNITVELLGAQSHVRNLCEPAMAAQPRSPAATSVWIIALDTMQTRASLVVHGGRWIGGVYRPRGTDWSIENRGSGSAKMITVAALPSSR